MTLLRSKRSLVIIAGLSLSVLLWSILLTKVSPVQIVDYIGIQNGYLVMFLVALFGGMTSFSAISYTATIVTLSAGGLQPLLLALSSGAGVSIGDSILFLVGKHSYNVISSSKVASFVERVSIWLGDRSLVVVWLFIFIYTAFTPMPADVLIIMLGLTKQSYGVVISAMVLGNITFAYLLSTAGGFF